MLEEQIKVQIATLTYDSKIVTRACYNTETYGTNIHDIALISEPKILTGVLSSGYSNVKTPTSPNYLYENYSIAIDTLDGNVSQLTFNGTYLAESIGGITPPSVGLQKFSCRGTGIFSRAIEVDVDYSNSVRVVTVYTFISKIN